jgi:hypothetical protein
MTKCHRCGLEGKSEEAFIKVLRSGFGRRYRYLCPRCWRKGKERKQLNSLILIAANGAIGACLVLMKAPGGWFFVNLFLGQIFLILGTLPHELGHALAARLLGMRLFQVSIGFGKVAYERRVGDFSIVIKNLPYGGLTLASHRTASWYRARHFLFIAAGPVANLLLAACIWPWLPPIRLDDYFSTFQPLPFFFGANLVIVVANLIPHRHRTQLGPIGSDGLQLLTTPFLSRKKIELRLANYFSHEGLLARRAGDNETARLWFEKAIARAPDDPSPRINQGVNLIDLGRLEEARAIFQSLLDSLPLKPLVRALVQNNLAYAGVRTGRKDLLEEADRLSLEAIGVLPAVAAIKGTRGSVLYALDRLDEALPLLKQAMDEATEPRSKALNACQLALLEQKRGNIEISNDYWKTARALDPACPLLKKQDPDSAPPSAQPQK